MFHFLVEQKMPGRVKALFSDQDKKVFEAGTAAIFKELERVKGIIRDPKSCQREFNEMVRPRETTFRFSEPQSFLTADPNGLAEELFKLYVRMEASVRPAPQLTMV